MYRCLAESKDDRYGKFNIGKYYHFGHGVTQNYEDAIKWYTASADTMWESCVALSLIYEQGLGVKKNWLLSQKWRIEYTLRGGSPDKVQQFIESFRKEAFRKEYTV